MDHLSTHPFFYDIRSSVLSNGKSLPTALEIGHDAWVGDYAVITPGCKRVGIGAVIGAGAVVTKDVPDFAIVVGNPARVLRFRFPPETIAMILASRWWELPHWECTRFSACMNQPLAMVAHNHPLLSRPALSSRASGEMASRQ